MLTLPGIRNPSLEVVNEQPTTLKATMGMKVGRLPSKGAKISRVVEMVPLKGGIGGIFDPPIGSTNHICTTYILPSGGLYAIYHLLGEPETTLENC